MFLGHLIGLLVLGYVVALACVILWNGILWLRQRRNQYEESQGDDPSPTLVITLIHGTWARTTAWTRTDSTLCKGISGALPHERIRFVRFNWSGRNSIVVRHRAAQALARTLEASTGRWPNARHLIIGHSHGGSVALLALHRQNIADRISGIVTLSTPFLVARRRSLSMVGALGLSVAPALLVVFGAGQLLNLLDLTPTIDAIPALQALAGFAFIAVGVYVVRRLPNLVAALGTNLLSRMEFPELPSDRLLIIRAPADEASAALNTAQMLSFLVSRIWDGTSSVLEAAVERLDNWGHTLASLGWRLQMVNGILLSAAVWLAFNASDASPGRFFPVVAGVLAGIALLSWSILWGGWAKVIGALILGVVALPLPVLLAVFALPVGPELAAAALLLEVTAEPTPPGRWTVWQFRPEEPWGVHRNRRGLMHSAAYEHQHALGEMFLWIQKRLHSD